MRIKRFGVGEVRVPLIQPFKTSLRQVTAIENTLVRLETDEGQVGFGEAAAVPYITGDTTGGVLAALAHLAGIIRDQPLEDPAIFELINGAMMHNTGAKAALDVAIHDVLAQAAGVSLRHYLNPLAGDTLVTDMTISVDIPQKMAADTARAVAEGFSILKVKVGTGVDIDIARLCAVREAAGSGPVLRLDANQGWTAAEAIRILQAIEDAELGAVLVEQPVAWWDVEGLKLVSAAIELPVLADESVHSVRDARQLIDDHAADMLNIKLMKTGGIHQARKIADYAAQAGVECMIGAMMESSVSITAAAQFALGASAVTMFDLDPPLLGSANPVLGGMTWQGETITMPHGVGNGVSGVAGATFVDVIR